MLKGFKTFGFSSQFYTNSESYCAGKALGWNAVGERCSKMAYLCEVATADQQQQNSNRGKMLCGKGEVVNPERQSECAPRIAVPECA